MKKTLKVVEKDIKDGVRNYCSYEIENVKNLEILTAAELLERGIRYFVDHGPYIHISLEDNGETGTYSCKAWRVEFI